MGHRVATDQGAQLNSCALANVLLHNKERLSSSRGLALLTAAHDDQTHAER